MTVEYRSPTAADVPAIAALLVALGWDDRARDEARLAAMIAGADRAVVAVEGGPAIGFGRVIGFARAITDGVSNGYLGTVAVAPEHQRSGIGRAMVERLIGTDPRITWVLRAGHASAPFWERLGFRRSELALERKRRE